GDVLGAGDDFCRGVGAARRRRGVGLADVAWAWVAAPLGDRVGGHVALCLARAVGHWNRRGAPRWATGRRDPDRTDADVGVLSCEELDRRAVPSVEFLALG